MGGRPRPPLLGHLPVDGYHRFSDVPQTIRNGRGRGLRGTVPFPGWGDRDGASRSVFAHPTSPSGPRRIRYSSIQISSMVSVCWIIWQRPSDAERLLLHVVAWLSHCVTRMIYGCNMDSICCSQMGRPDDIEPKTATEVRNAQVDNVHDRGSFRQTEDTPCNHRPGHAVRIHRDRSGRGRGTRKNY